MQRLYIKDLKLGEGSIKILSKEIIHQLSVVLRYKQRDKIILFDSINPFDFVYEIISIDKKSVVLNFLEKIEKKFPLKNLSLYQALPNKISKIELILQKGVEVGYSNFYFFSFARSQKLNISPNKIKRFEKIVIEASEQSGSNIIPKIKFLDKLDFENISGDTFYFHTQKENSEKLKNINFSNKNINIFIGPEGGFTSEEDELFAKNFYKKINLGNKILRTETTGIVVGFYILQG